LPTPRRLSSLGLDLDRRPALPRPSTCAQRGSRRQCRSSPMLSLLCRRSIITVQLRSYMQSCRRYPLTLLDFDVCEITSALWPPFRPGCWTWRRPAGREAHCGAYPCYYCHQRELLAYRRWQFRLRLITRRRSRSRLRRLCRPEQVKMTAAVAEKVQTAPFCASLDFRSGKSPPPPTKPRSSGARIVVTGGARPRTLSP
jgi:hypothetical protein